MAVVLPAVFLLGESSFAALWRNPLENLVLLRRMQRIRGYYRSLVPEADQFFGPAAEDERYSAAMATVGLRARPAGCCSPGQRDRRDQQHRGRCRPGAAGRQGRELGDGRRAGGRHRRRRGPVRLHLLYQQQRAASLVLRPAAEAASA